MATLDDFIIEKIKDIATYGKDQAIPHDNFGGTGQGFGGARNRGVPGYPVPQGMRNSTPSDDTEHSSGNMVDETSKLKALAAAAGLALSDVPHDQRDIHHDSPVTDYSNVCDADVDQPVAKPPIDQHIRDICRKYSIPPELIHAMIDVESSGDVGAVSNRGAQGLMQLMPKTAKMLGVNDPYDPHENIEGGVKYVRHLANRFNGNLDMTLAAYNAGPTAVASKKKSGESLPAETQEYINKIKKRLGGNIKKINKETVALHDRGPTDLSGDQRVDADVDWFTEEIIKEIGMGALATQPGGEHTGAYGSSGWSRPWLALDDNDAESVYQKSLGASTRALDMNNPGQANANLPGFNGLDTDSENDELSKPTDLDEHIFNSLKTLLGKE